MLKFIWKFLVFFCMVSVVFAANSSRVCAHHSYNLHRSHHHPHRLHHPHHSPRSHHETKLTNYYPCPNSGYYLYSGTVQENIKRLATAHGNWRVIWDSPNDYRWEGSVTIYAAGIKEAVGKIVEKYPLQAVFYDKNRVLLIRPRTIIK